MKVTNQKRILAALALLIFVFAVAYFWPKQKLPDNQPKIDQANDSARYYKQHADEKELLRKNAENEAEIKRTEYELLRNQDFKIDHPTLWNDMRERNRAEILDSINAAEVRDSLRRQPNNFKSPSPGL